MNQGTEAMKGLESRAASSLGLAGDAGEPLLLVLALLNAAEVSWLLGRQALSSSFELLGTSNLTHVCHCAASVSAAVVSIAFGTAWDGRAVQSQCVLYISYCGKEAIVGTYPRHFRHLN